MNRVNATLYLLVFSAWAWLTGPLTVPAAPPVTTTPPPKTRIPYVATRHDTVRDLLWLAETGTNDVVYDLGSGDGRVVLAAVRDFHARRAVGIELDAALLQASRSNALAAGLAERVAFIHGDLFTNDFSAASVLVLYLGHRANLDLRVHILRSLKPGARVVSHQFGMGEWVKDKTLDVRTPILGMYGERFNEFKTNPDVPDFDDSRSRASHDELSVWVVPAPVAGVWRGKVHTDTGEGELKLTLHQRLSSVSGFYHFQGPTNLAGSVTADLWGEHLRCSLTPTQDGLRNQMWVDAFVKEDNLRGALTTFFGTNSVETEWLAHRDPADFTGTWEWLGASNAPVQLKMERRDGRLAAIYTDKNREKTQWRDDTQPIPVFDVYEFGGGFYFTLLLGLEGDRYSQGSRRMGPQDGWLVGEAIMEDGTLHGTLAFYPYPSTLSQPTDAGQPQQTNRRAAPPAGRREWQPKRVAP